MRMHRVTIARQNREIRQEKKAARVQKSRQVTKARKGSRQCAFGMLENVTQGGPRCCPSKRALRGDGRMKWKIWRKKTKP